MAILTIRKYQRFAVRRMANLHNPGRQGRSGLLVEVSLDGCRLGITEGPDFAVGTILTMHIEGVDEIMAEVRWSGNGFLGLRFLHSLHVADLDRLIRACRPEPVRAEPQQAYAM